MAKLPEEFLTRLKSANDIVDMFRLYANVKKRGRIYVCCCPFHAEKTPSCTIYPDNNSFYCFGCHEGGDVITFIMKKENLTYMEAVRTLAQRCGMTIPEQNPHDARAALQRDRCYEMNREAAKFYFRNLLSGDDKRGLQFLISHHIQPQTVKKYGLGFAPADGYSLLNYLKQKGCSEQELIFSGLCRKNPFCDFFQNRILFPVLDMRGNVTGFVGMEIDYRPPVIQPTENYSFQNQNLFSLHLAKDAASENIILAEDAFNAAAIWQAGFANVIAVPGDTITTHHVKLIAQRTKELIVVSSPCSGQNASQQMLNLFSRENLPVRIIQIRNAQNSCEFINAYGAGQFRELLDKAPDAFRAELESVKTIASDIPEDDETIIQKSIDILAGIRNPLEREVYLTNTAHDLQIPLETLRGRVDKKISGRPKQTFSGSRSLTQAELNFSQSKTITNEKHILFYLLQHPGESDTLQRKIPPDMFLSDDYQRLYQTLCEILPNRPEISASALKPFFTDEDFNLLKSLLRDSRDFPISPDDLNLYISELKRG